MHRRPIYAKNNEGFRIVSVPNGMWRLQERGAFPSTREHSGWHFMSPPRTLDEAQAILARHHREIKAT